MESVEKTVTGEVVSSNNTETDGSDEGFGLGDNLLGILAEALIPFLGTLQDLLGGLVNGLIGGLIATLKSLLEGLLGPVKAWFEFVVNWD